MNPELVESLSSLLANSTLFKGAPKQLRGDLQLALARSLTSAGDLQNAADVLSRVHTEDNPERRRELAAQLQRLARASVGSADPLVRKRAEIALREAADLDPAHGLPALAQYLQRNRRIAEALEVWRKALAASPNEPTLYLNLAGTHEQLGQPDQALGIYLQLVDECPSARTYLTVASRINDLAPRLSDVPAGRKLRIALLGNATLDQLQSYLKVECYRSGLRPTIYQAPFDQVTQEVLDPRSGLYAFAPDVLICAVHASRLFPQIHRGPSELSLAERRAEIERGLGSVDQLLAAFTQRSPALVLLHNMVAPQHPELGILDWRHDLGQAELFSEINSRLADLVRERYRTVYLVDEDRIQAQSGKARATDARLWLTYRVAWSDAVHLGLARNYMRYLKSYRSLNGKCIVLDLDNTLWGGVVGEDGVEGIQLGADAPGNAFVLFQTELERLWRRGIMLAVCSKNNIEDALPVFERHPAMVLRRTHLAAHRINWQPKTANLREIAAELNIGLDSLVFLDDNPVERANVRRELPEVMVPELPTDPAEYRAALLQLDVFESLILTSEDRERGRMYAQQAQRRDFEASRSGVGLDDYLAGLSISVEICPATPAMLPRIAQLTNKTNQFNVTTRRYSEADICGFLSKGWDVFGIRVTDRFGDNGLVGVAVLGPAHGGSREIDSLLLSCRVMGRGVETVLLSSVAEHARASGASRLLGRFIPSSKNAPARDCYQRHGFKLAEQDATGSQLWELDLATADIKVPGWLTVRIPEVVG